MSAQQIPQLLRTSLSDSSLDEMAFSRENRKVIALFDFDNTLSKRDSLLPFLRHLVGTLPLFRALASSTPHLLSYLANLSSRQEVKEALLSQTVKGFEKSQFSLLANHFSHNMLPSLLDRQAMKRLDWHLSCGHSCYLVSAAIEDYLIPWAKKYGFCDIIATKLGVDQANRLTGKLHGNNCWGDEKVRRLLKAISGNELQRAFVYAYGDSAGDYPMLRCADAAFLY